MYDFLRDHALRNVWCTPDQDNQAMLELAKITPFGGTKREFKVMWSYVDMPDLTSSWHLFQIGQVHPLVLGLFPKMNEWTRFDEACNIQKMICDIYTVDGVQIPRFETYYRFTSNRNLLVAVKKNTKIPFNFNTDKVFLRLYSNEFFKSSRASGAEDFIHVQGARVASTQDILDLQADYDTHVARDGQTYAFVNGLKVDNIGLVNVAVGDVAEFVYDSSIYKVVDFLVSDLLTFDSTLDLKKKYLLNYAGTDNGTIDFQDDVDVFVLKDEGSNHHTGLFYHKNNEDAFRSLTHRDYSATVPYVTGYVAKLQTLEPAGSVITKDKTWIRLHIRKSGYQRNLIFENNRIHELYKMQSEDVAKAMLGFDATVINWRAETLEHSSYTKIMRVVSNDVTNNLAEEAYGYNALSYYGGNTPSDVYDFSGNPTVDVPYIHQKGCTAYEYDDEGHLLGWHYHAVGTRYTCDSPDAVLVELIAGKGGTKLNEVYDFRSTPHVKEFDYRVYECRRASGLPDNNFKDVTGGQGKYSVDNDRILWLDEDPTRYPMVRFNSHFLAYDTEVSISSGQLKVTLTHEQTRGTNTSNWIMQTPMGELDVFLNGKSLIKDLDYVYNFPEILIISKEHLDDVLNEPQKVHIRFTGFCKATLELSEVIDVGYIEHEVFSNNKIFNIRDDKVLRITMNGSLKSRGDLVFSEFHQGVSILNATNGKPYQVKDIVVPLRGISATDTYTLRDSSLEIDGRVSDYLTKKIPQPERPALSAIVNRYKIFSPFIAKILYNLVTGDLVIADKIHSKAEILTILKPYEYLLKFDPTQEERKIDSRYVIVHPHAFNEVLGVPLNSYRFVDLANRTYTRSLVNLSPFLIIV